MLDPLSALGAASGIIQIAAAALSVVQTLTFVAAKYGHAAPAIAALSSQCRLVRALLLDLDKQCKDPHNNVTAHLQADPDLRAELNGTILGCARVYADLQNELEKLSTAYDSDKQRLSWKDTTKYVVKEKVFEEYTSQIEGHKSALTLLIQNLNM